MTPHAIPSKLADDLRRGLVATQALEAARDWLEHRSPALVLQGGTGAGKSNAAAWLHEHFAARPLFSQSGSRRGPAWFAAKVLGTLDARDRETVDTWRAFDSATLITIDDAGTEPFADRISSAIERVWDVTSARLCITTNLDREAFGKRYGDRVVSRLSGAGWVILGSPDYRVARPTGAAWPSPAAPTAREAKASAEAEAQRIADEAEAEATREAREKAAADAFAQIKAIIASLDARHTFERSASDRADDERRRELREQVRLRLVGGE